MFKKAPIVILLLFSALAGHCQEWRYNVIGNAFDGYVKTASVEGVSTNPSRAELTVNNLTDSLMISYGTAEMLEGLTLKLIMTDGDFLDVRHKVQKVYMSFDTEKTVYALKAEHSTSGNSVIYFEYALGEEYKIYLNKLDIIQQFQTREVVHFRIQTNTNSYDYAFQLNGSTESIDQIVKIDYQKKGDQRDQGYERAVFRELLEKTNNGELDYSFAASNCLDYLADEYNEFFFLTIESVEQIKVDSNEVLVFKDGSGQMIADIPLERALRNTLYFSGQVKIQDGTFQRDIETLELYYRAFKSARLIKDLSLDEFADLTEVQLEKLYYKAMAYEGFLDWLRIYDHVYIHYEPAEYTFDVFIEAWGISR